MQEKTTQIHEWNLVGDVLITATVPGVIPGGVWQAYLDFLQHNQIRIIISLSKGTVTIDAKMRKEVAEVLGGRNLQTIVVTDSRITRGVLTAMSWMGAKFHSFSWAELDKAVALTDAPAETQAELTRLGLAFDARTAQAD